MYSSPIHVLLLPPVLSSFCDVSTEALSDLAAFKRFQTHPVGMMLSRSGRAESIIRSRLCPITKSDLGHSNTPSIQSLIFCHE